jgi:hypothetical protein
MPKDLGYPRAERWATAVVAAVRCDRDPRTLAAWAASVAVSRGALRAWCRAARVSARSSLDFVRFLRVICRAPRTLDDPLDLLDWVDPRTIARMLSRGGLCSEDLRATVGRPDLFLDAQRFVSDPILVGAAREVLFGESTGIRHRLGAHSTEPSTRAPAVTAQRGSGDGAL